MAIFFLIRYALIKPWQKQKSFTINENAAAESKQAFFYKTKSWKHKHTYIEHRNKVLLNTVANKLKKFIIEIVETN